MCLVSGCVAASGEPSDSVESKSPSLLTIDPVAAAQIENTFSTEDAGPDLCAHAAQLPADDACSLICDPGALADYLVAEGMHTGACYQLRCSLPGVDNVVGVGVCLAP